jgi:competence protein ComEC
MFNELIEWLQKHKNRVIIIVIVLIALDTLVYWQIFALSDRRGDLLFYFLEVGQGDGSLVVLPGGVKILIDGGPPNGRVLEALAKALPPTERYLDLVILSHPELDHFGGLIEVLRRYRVGIFIHNGRAGTASAFEELKAVINEKGVKTINLGAGDRIRHQKSVMRIISPDSELVKRGVSNDTSLVFALEAGGARALFTGDISAAIEEKLVGFSEWAPVDILKVAHHGSKYSSSARFLSVARPRLAAIGVGKNFYGHPTREALSRLLAAGATIYRTDQDGTIKVLLRKNNEVEVFKF